MSNALQRYREKVAVVINDYVKEFGTREEKHSSEIREYLLNKLGELDVMFQESDMCYDKTNKDNLKSYPTDIKLFESMSEKAVFRILGENYPYNGDVIWKRRTKNDFIKVGHWNNGILDYYGDKINILDKSSQQNIKAEKNKTERPKINSCQKDVLENTNLNIKTFDVEAVKKIDKFLRTTGIVDIKKENTPVLQRESGKIFSLNEHIRGMIYSLLTNIKKWNEIEPKLQKIDSIFFNYNSDEIKKHEGTYFEKEIEKIKCGNVNIKKQMSELKYNIEIFENIINEYGSMDAFVTSEKSEVIVKFISSQNSKYKLKNIGETLAWEYLRNVGIDGGKPDRHLKRFFGCNRIAISEEEDASNDEVTKELNKLAATKEYNRFEIDYLIWCYCASGKGEICTANPNCKKCVIKEYCKYSY